ncbi:unnamed protein product [Pleuronectes platessa]|uniref:TNF family profile domain-containing protein n=1 Tax=Pleuronectes platessa TaxID=8262 RepID=A0A9N7VF23_PLEPL|nr:tumor necrosis factor ligand superfamily member 18 [Pleuronectes platessa]CAB1449748.1 unnamed protein product [Pleuronectes platessa]
MPQRTQHCLVHVLLLWTIVLSIMQVVFIIFYFTVGRQFSSDHDLGEGKMLTFQAADDNRSTKWVADNSDPSLVSEGYNLTIQRDGYYFLSLQVTLISCEGEEHTVTLKREGKILLVGWIKTKPCTTGLLGKVEELSAGWTLEVAINPKPKNRIKTDKFATHLDIIYMLRP